MGAYVDESGKVHYIDEEGDSGSAWDYITKHLPKAVGQTFGEAITPSLSPVGGYREGGDVGTARQWIDENLGLENRGGESIPEALLKGAGEGVLNVFLPETGVDVVAQGLAEAGGGAAEAARGLQGARRAVEAATTASDAVRGRATTKLQEAARRPGEVWQGRPGGGTPPGYHTQRMENRRLNLGGEERPRLPREGVPEGQRYRGPRPTETDVAQFEGGGRPDRGIPAPTEQHPLNRAVASGERSAARAESHQLNMQRYRAGQEIAREMLEKQGRLPTPEEIARIDDPVARQAVEEFVQNQGRIASDLQEGRNIAGELGERRQIADELAQRREIQQELGDRRRIAGGLQERPPTQDMPTMTSPTQPAPTNPRVTMPPTPEPPPTLPIQEGPGPKLPYEGYAPTSRQATMPPPGQPAAGPPTSPMGRTPTGGGGIGDVARREAARRAARGASPSSPTQTAPTAPQPPDANPLAALLEPPSGSPQTMPGGQARPMSQNEQLAALEGLPDYGHWRINVLMQELFKNNPDMTLEEFMRLMRQGGGSQGAPPLPF